MEACLAREAEVGPTLAEVRGAAEIDSTVDDANLHSADVRSLPPPVGTQSPADFTRQHAEGLLQSIPTRAREVAQTPSIFKNH